jgi:hypothetical protein
MLSQGVAAGRDDGDDNGLLYSEYVNAESHRLADDEIRN